MTLMCIICCYSVCFKMHPIKGLIIINLCHLCIYAAQLAEITVCSCGVCTVYSILIALQGHRRFALFVVSTPHQIVAQHTVVGRAMTIEELDVWLNIEMIEALEGVECMLIVARDTTEEVIMTDAMRELVK